MLKQVKRERDHAPSNWFRYSYTAKRYRKHPAEMSALVKQVIENEKQRDGANRPGPRRRDPDGTFVKGKP